MTTEFIRDDTTGPKIQILVSEEGDQRALHGLLEEQYDVVSGENLQSVDCYLLDDRTLPAYHDELRQRKQEQDPTFCPVLLIQRKETSKSVAQLGQAESDDVQLVDEVVPAPVDRKTLHRRLRNLLVRNEQSIELSRRYEQIQTRFQRVFEATNDAIFVVDPDSDEIIECNPAACELVGYTHDELRGVAPSETLHTAGRDTYESFLHRVRETGEGWTDEFVCKTKDGGERSVEVSGATVEYADRSGVVFSVRDVAERKERERELETAHRRFDSVFNNPYTIISIMEPNGSLKQINQTKLDLADTTLEDVQNEPLWETPWWNQSDALQDKIRTATERAAAGEPVQVGATHRMANGRLFISDGILQPVIADDGEVTEIIRIAQDITELRAREQRLGVLNRVLRHNLRNSMNAIEGYASLLSERVTDTDLQDYTDSIKAQTNQLLTISEKAREVQDLFDRESETDYAYDISGLLSDLAADFEAEYPDIEITVSRPESMHITAGERLKRAIREAVANAVIHNNQSSPEVTITARASDVNDPDEWVDIVIEDNGPGIPETEQNVIEKGKEKPISHGSGLGLWLMYWIITIAGGRMTIEERSPQGTRVRFTLPRISEDSQPPPAEDERADTTLPESQTDHERKREASSTTSTNSPDRDDEPAVLIVDDETGLADLYEVWLSDSYTVTTVYGGEEALKLLDDSVDVVFLDRRMPDLSGDEVLSRIHENGFDVRVVLISAAGPDFDLLDVPFDGYLVKSADTDDLQDAVERMMDRAAYDESTQRLARLLSTKLVLEEHKHPSKLRSHDGYHELLNQITTLYADDVDLPAEFNESDIETPISEQRRAD